MTENVSFLLSFKNINSACIQLKCKWNVRERDSWLQAVLDRKQGQEKKTSQFYSQNIKC